jgi:hypothetical protein
MQDPPGRTPNGLNMIHGPKIEIRDATPRHILDVILFQRFLSTPDAFGPDTGAIGSMSQLSYYPYQVRPNPTKYATWASILVRAVPGVRNRLEPDTDWASNSTWTPLLVS